LAPRDQVDKAVLDEEDVEVGLHVLAIEVQAGRT
jgi:hypothetical protein